MPSFVVFSTLSSVHVVVARGIVSVSFTLSAAGDGAGVGSGDFESMSPAVVEVGSVCAFVVASGSISSCFERCDFDLARGDLAVGCCEFHGWLCHFAAEAAVGRG